jgi:hypothetical protein
MRIEIGYGLLDEVPAVASLKQRCSIVGPKLIFGCDDCQLPACSKRLPSQGFCDLMTPCQLAAGVIEISQAFGQE